ncbi:hypothetical protein Tco_1351195 [Tanacetum coccineum]
MCTYLKNMAGWKPKDLKTKSFANVQELFDKVMKRVNIFVDMDTELVGGSGVREEGSKTREESSSKRVGDELEQEPSKKQNMEDDKETTKLQIMMKVISDEEEVVVDAIPLATKPPSIMLKSFDREDLETLWTLVKAKHGYTKPEKGYKRVLWGDLKTMFEHNIEDTDKFYLDHPLSYALTATANVAAVCLQRFWKIVNKVPDTKDTIKFNLDRQEIVYTIDMFRDTLHLPVETPNNPFIELVNIKVIESSMQKVGYQCVVDKVSAFYTKFLAQPWQTMFKVFNRCLTTRTSRHDQIKINIIQLFYAVVNRVHVYHASLFWNLLFRGILIPDGFLADEIHATNDYAEYETVFVKSSGEKEEANCWRNKFIEKSLKVTVKQKKTTLILPLSDDKERDEIAKATLLSLTMHKTTLVAEAQENVAKVQEKLVEKEIEKMVEGEEDKELYASEFVDSMLNDDVDDFGTRIEPESHKENPEVVVNDDDDETEKEKKDAKKDDAEEKDNDDHTDHTLVGT